MEMSVVGWCPLKVKVICREMSVYSGLTVHLFLDLSTLFLYLFFVTCCRSKIALQFY